MLLNHEVVTKYKQLVIDDDRNPKTDTFESLYIDKLKKLNIKHMFMLKSSNAFVHQVIDKTKFLALLTPLLLSSVNAGTFSPSAFMNLDTRVGVATFGGVSTLGTGRPMTLRSRADCTLPKRYIHPSTPAKVKRGGKRPADVLVRLFLTRSSVAIDICGGKVGRRPNVQACVATSGSCLVSSHSNKAETFEPGHRYIQTPTKAGCLMVYLDQSVAVNMLSNASVGFLLSQEFSVQSWLSLLPRIAFCSQEEIESSV